MSILDTLRVSIKRVNNSLKVRGKKHSSDSFVSTSLRFKHQINKNNSSLCQLCLLSLYLFWLAPLCIFYFLFINFLGADDTMVNWWKVKHSRGYASTKIYVENFARKVRNTEVDNKNLASCKISEIKTVISTKLYYYWPPRYSLSPVQRSRCRFDLLNLSIQNMTKIVLEEVAKES